MTNGFLPAGGPQQPKFQGALITVRQSENPTAQIRLLPAGASGIGDDEVRLTTYGEEGKRTIEFASPAIGELSAKLSAAFQQKMKTVIEQVNGYRFRQAQQTLFDNNAEQAVLMQLPDALEALEKNPDGIAIRNAYLESEQEDYGSRRTVKLHYPEAAGPNLLRTSLEKLAAFSLRTPVEQVAETNYQTTNWLGNTREHASPALVWNGPLNEPQTRIRFIDSFKDFEEASNNRDPYIEYRRNPFSPVGMNDTVIQLRKTYRDSAIAEILTRAGLSKETVQRLLQEEKRALTLEQAKAELASVKAATAEAPVNFSGQKLLDVLTELCGEDASNLLQGIADKRLSVEPMSAEMAVDIRGELVGKDIATFNRLIGEGLLNVASTEEE